MDFQQWLFNERVEIPKEFDNSVTISQGIGRLDHIEKKASLAELQALLRKGIQNYYNRIDPKGYQFLKKRYDFKLLDVRDHWDAATFQMRIVPKTKGGERQKSTPDMHSYEFDKEHRGGYTGRILYKTPKNAIESIPANPTLGYRGMAWEEWQSIRRIGRVQSREIYNLGQEGYTMFGQRPDTAESYAHGFAPLQYKITHKTPGIVIAVPRSFLLTHDDDPKNIPQSELGLKGSMPASAIVSIWMLTPASSSERGGYFELRFKWITDDKQRFSILDPKHVALGSGDLTGISGYAIRQIK